jgi:hypothetical protein
MNARKVLGTFLSVLTVVSVAYVVGSLFVKGPFLISQIGPGAKLIVTDHSSGKPEVVVVTKIIAVPFGSSAYEGQARDGRILSFEHRDIREVVST